MIEDMRHLEVLEAFGREVQDIITAYNARANGQTDKHELATLWLERNTALIDLLTQQRRALEFMAGKPVEPQTHFGEAIVIGTMGGGA